MTRLTDYTTSSCVFMEASRTTFLTNAFLAAHRQILILSLSVKTMHFCYNSPFGACACVALCTNSLSILYASYSLSRVLSLNNCRASQTQLSRREKGDLPDYSQKAQSVSIIQNRNAADPSIELFQSGSCGHIQVAQLADLQVL